MTYAHMTTGTTTFLQNRVEDYDPALFTFMRNRQTTAVYYESTKKSSIFSAGSSFTILKSYLPIPDKGFVIIQHIPVARETNKLFIQKMNDSFDSFTLARGLHAARVLEAKKRNNFAVMMVWENEAAYDEWMNNDRNETDFTSLVRKPTYFVERAFTQTYQIIYDDIHAQ